jgi:hypothetical protein
MKQVADVTLCWFPILDPEDRGDISSKKSHDDHRTARRYIPEDKTLQLLFIFIKLKLN